MGKSGVSVGPLEGARLQRFTRRLLDDLVALEHLLRSGAIEEGVRRIGAEQELFLVDRAWSPARCNLDLLEQIDDPAFTTELGRFNLEINLDPLEFRGDALREMERTLEAKLAVLREVADRHGVHVALCGILPSMRKSDLGGDAMTPLPRYHALDAAMTAERRGGYELHIKGLDELSVTHDTVLLEACNASFQLHVQTGVEEFPNLYNVAQILTAPVLAIAANSPLLFGRQLWMETRIALFQQSVDTRSVGPDLRIRSPRVTFGSDWVTESVVELYREDVARFRPLVTDDAEDDSLEAIRRGETPTLSALALHNGTVYRWNRACFGTSGARPHLRIENRVLPSGPSVVDQIANAALWYGCLIELAHRHPNVAGSMRFADAKNNFRAASRLGMSAQLTWLDGTEMPVVDLVRDHLLPAAREGLARCDIDAADRDEYLGVVEERIDRGQNGARWLVRSDAAMRDDGSDAERLNALTAALVARQRDRVPVARWDPARIEEGGGWRNAMIKVEQCMTADLFTVREDEPVEMVANLMDWKHIRHVPVEDADGGLVGLISYRTVIRMMARADLREKLRTAGDLMVRDPETASPDTPTVEAMHRMQRGRFGCLPVVKEGRLVGILTERDFVKIAIDLIQDAVGPFEED